MMKTYDSYEKMAMQSLREFTCLGGKLWFIVFELPW